MHYDGGGSGNETVFGFCDCGLPLFLLKISPGLGYGLCWYKGPDTVESTPVLASA